MATDILLIDDDRDICDALRSLLEGEGYQVQTAQDGAMALKLSRSEPPAVMITDITMPNMGGLELLAYLKQHAMPCAVAMLTAHAELDLVAKSLQLGAVDYLLKPFEIDDLLDRIPAWVEIGKQLQAIRQLALTHSGIPQKTLEQMRAVELARIRTQYRQKQSA